MSEEFAELFARVRGFDWNPRKREINLRRHKIDFADVKGIFDGYTFVRRSDRHGEIRYQIFGYLQGREIAVAFTIRGDVCWLISARRARRDERQKFYQGLAR
ncbi:MAG: BrnT family toxin [Pseudomonadota bacterium]